MEGQQQHTKLTRIGGRDRGPERLVAVIIAVLVLAILKPWAGGALGFLQAGSGAGKNAMASIAPSASPAPTIFDPNALPCMTPSSERLVSIIRWPGHEIRTWQATDDVAASGPLDPQLVALSLVSAHVIGIGICAVRPEPADQFTAAGQLLDVQLIVTGSKVSRAIDLGAPLKISVNSASDLAILYGPPRPAVARSPSPAMSPIPDGAWPVGSYGLGFRLDSDGAARIHWLRLNIEAPPGGPDSLLP